MLRVLLPRAPRRAGACARTSQAGGEDDEVPPPPPHWARQTDEGFAAAAPPVQRIERTALAAWLERFNSENRLATAAERASRRAHLASLQQRSEAWFRARHGFLSGSNFNAILGGDAFRTAGDVWDQLFGLRSARVDNADTRRGVRYEDAAVAAYAAASGRAVRATGLHQHADPAYCMVASSPDGLVGDDGVVEVKCPRPSAKALALERVPPWHEAQVQGHMHCTGRAWCDYVVYVVPPSGRAQMRVIRVLRDDAYWERVLGPGLQSFWRDHVETGVRPAR